MLRNVLIFGARGDLAGRKLFPALARLEERHALPDDLTITGLGRRVVDDRAFAESVAAKLDEHAAAVDRDARRALLARLRFKGVDATSPDEVAARLSGLPEPALVYLAVPPAVYPPCVDGLARAGLPRDSVVVLEKPFGENLRSAIQLNRSIERGLPHARIFRIDHFLGKQAVRGILALRFANRVFEPAWSAPHVERVEIAFDETLGLEGRAGFYDGTGALRDMIQSHLLQLLALIAMEQPRGLATRDLADARVQVLRATRRLSAPEVRAHTLRGRYTEGRIGDRTLPDYIAEKGVDPSRNTETFAEVELFVDSPRWVGVPFVLRSGKALGRARSEALIHFAAPPRALFPDAAAGVLRLQFEPDGVSLAVNALGGADRFALEEIALAAKLPPAPLPAYARLLEDALAGDDTLSVRGDEAEEAWRIVEPILEVWGRGDPPLVDYAAGSDGPVRERVPPGGAGDRPAPEVPGARPGR